MLAYINVLSGQEGILSMQPKGPCMTISGRLGSVIQYQCGHHLTC